MGRGLYFSYSLTERSTEEETPIARAVSGSLCVCELCSLPTFITVLRICSDFINWPFVKRGEMATGSSKVASPNTELVEDDLKLLYNTLYRIRKKYALLGMQIGLKKSEIDDIGAQKLDPSMSLLEVLSVRVKKAEALTWNDIYNALRSECIDESKLAKEMWAKHLFIPESSTESESEQEHEIKSEEIKRVKKRAPKKQKGGDHRARVSKERERSSEDEGTETVRSKKHVQEVESEDEEDAVLSRKEKEKVRRKGAHYQYKEVHDKERPKGKNKKEKFMKDESQSEQEDVVREKSKRKKKATHDREESVKGYGDRDHYSDTEVCEKVRKRSKKHEVYTESESEASSDEDEMENSSFDDDTSQKGSARRKLTKHTQVKIKERYPQKEHRKDEKKKDAKFRGIEYSDEEVSTKSAKKLRKLTKVETESEEKSSFASSSDEEEIEVHKSTKKTESAARTKDTAHYESEEKGKTSGKKRVSKSATAEASQYPEEYKDKGRKKAVRVDEKVGKSTDSSRETYHKIRSKPPRKETEGRDGLVSGKKAKKATAPPLERDLPSSEMAQTDSGDGESDESSEDESVQYPKRLKFEETQPFSHDSDKHVYGKGSVGWKGRTAGVKRSLKSKARRPYGTQRGGIESKDVRSVQSQAPFSGYESKQEIPSHPLPKQKSNAECASEHLLSSEEEMPSSSLVLSRPSKTSSVLGGIEMSRERSDSESSSREQEEPDSPEERRRRKRIRETSDTPLASDRSSYPTSGNETRRKYDNSEWQRMNAMYHRRGRERHRQRVRQEGSSSSSDSADSSPECDRILSESERRKLKKLFKCAFGRLCLAITNPADVAAELQAKRLLSRSTTESILSSPESRQAKAIFLVRALARRIKPRPDRVFTAIEVFCSSEGLQDIGKEMKIKAGKSPFIL